MAFFAIQIQSCSSDDDGGAPVDNLETNYLTIENAVFNDQDFPEATLDEPLDGVDMSSQVMNGAMNYISVVTEKEIQKFFVGVKGVDGYWEMDASTTITRATQYNTYVIPVMISQNYFGNSVIQVSGMLTDGSITLPIEKEMEYIETKLGDLEVKLAFSNCKDVDLHLYTPSEEHIYYGHKGGTYYTEDGDTITYGLDIDSNAGCRIDSINKENIYIPQELIEAGTYKVVVNMYSNCDYTIPTSWSVVVRYKGELIATSTGENPATGVYPVGARNGDYTEAMTFVIEEPEVRGARRSRIIPESFEPIPMTDMDMMKLADEQ